jgi:hypothetical protein
MELLDIVVLLKAVPEKRLNKGQVGAIVEKWAEDVYEVEFADKEGKTIAFMAAKENELMRIFYEPLAA